ncbi:MAG: XkdX family protein [Oscillospiraceae bacterium]|nr:XkdX family protein [Oscillospiraceae bacterium]MBQ9249928.1 XkdX family protein [Oscillospiraceae bacterium]
MAKTEHSKNFDKVKKYYKAGVWNEARVRNAVTNPASNPWITDAEYEEITGQPYDTTEEETPEE